MSLSKDKLFHSYTNPSLNAPNVAKYFLSILACSSPQIFSTMFKSGEYGGHLNTLIPSSLSVCLVVAAV